jgi:hypothetical protein
MAVYGAGATIAPKEKLAQGGAACYQCAHWDKPFENPITHDLYGIGPISPINTWAACTCPSFPDYLTKELAKELPTVAVKTKTRKIEQPTTNLYITNRTYSCPYMSFKKESGDSIGEDNRG